jgi:multidrug efflux pump subunit AcrA (membrane-fusion protein)
MCELYRDGDDSRLFRSMQRRIEPDHSLMSRRLVYVYGGANRTVNTPIRVGPIRQFQSSDEMVYQEEEPSILHVNDACNDGDHGNHFIKVVQLDAPITCSITLEELQVECHELPCGHQFSADIYEWVNDRKNNNCPLCRKAVDESKPAVNSNVSSWSNVWERYVRRIEAERINGSMWIDPQEMQSANEQIMRNQRLTDADFAFFPTDYTGVPSDRDLLLVMDQTGRHIRDAFRALRRTDGDIVNAILELTMEDSF